MIESICSIFLFLILTLDKNEKLAKNFKDRLEGFVRQMAEQPIKLENPKIYNPKHDLNYKFRNSIMAEHDSLTKISEQIRSRLRTTNNSKLGAF